MADIIHLGTPQRQVRNDDGFVHPPHADERIPPYEWQLKRGHVGAFSLAIALWIGLLAFSAWYFFGAKVISGTWLVMIGIGVIAALAGSIVVLSEYYADDADESRIQPIDSLDDFPPPPKGV